LFSRARWFLGLNRRTSQRPRQCYRHAKRSNRFQIFPHIRIFPFGSYLLCFSGITYSSLKVGLFEPTFGCTPWKKTGLWEFQCGRHQSLAICFRWDLHFRKRL
jgi:hypothetical protein